jgi:hypothetical protein
MKVLLRDLSDGRALPPEVIAGLGLEHVSGYYKLVVDLGRVPVADEEIHWDNHIARVYKTMHFPDAGEDGIVACCYVVHAI